MSAAPSQRDYGNEGSDTPLVPGSLRLYRHFKGESSRLFPMNSIFNGENPYDNTDIGLYVASCHKANRGGAAWASQVYSTSVGVSNTEHGPSPKKSCQCGFYAHYEPTTDFYPDYDWSIEQGPGPKIMIKAVVEMQGRVVLGTKGVRGERMKIVAIAPDWTKFRSQEWHTELNNAMSYDRYRKLRNNPEMYPPSPEDRSAVEMSVLALSLKYKCEMFHDSVALHAAYPAQDVSALLAEDKHEPQPQPSPESLKRVAAKFWDDLKNIDGG